MKKIMTRAIGAVCMAMLAAILLAGAAFATNLKDNVLTLTETHTNSAKVFVAAYDANGKMLFSKVQPSAQKTVSADFSAASVVRVYETDASCCPTKLSSIVLLESDAALSGGSYDSVVLANGVKATLNGVKTRKITAQAQTQLTLNNSTVSVLEVKNGGSLRFNGDLSVNTVTLDESSTLTVTGKLLSENVTTPLDGIGAANIICTNTQLNKAIEDGGEYFVYCGGSFDIDSIYLEKDLKLYTLETLPVELSSVDVSYGVETINDNAAVAHISVRQNIVVTQGTTLYIGENIEAECNEVYNYGYFKVDGVLHYTYSGGESPVLELKELQRNMRQRAIDYSRSLANTVWYTKEDINFSLSKAWTPTLIYHKNTPFTGLPYTSDRISANANLDEFNAVLGQDAGGIVYQGETTYNEMPGTDCGGQVRLAYAWAGALCDQELEEMVFDPNSGDLNCGVVPVGDIEVAYFDRSGSKETVCDINGEQRMFEAYAQLQPGDILFETLDNGEHIMMVTQNYGAVRTDGEYGEIVPEKSKLRVLEITSEFAVGGIRQDFWSNWNEKTVTFRSNFNYGYIPMTTTAFNNTELAEPVIDTELLHIDDECSFYDLMSGQIRCNYNIFRMTLEVTDLSGRMLCTGTSYPNSLIADLCELDFGEDLVNLPSGDYHVRLVIKTGLFIKTIVDDDVSYTRASAQPTVYISDNGTGNGSSAAEALGNAPGFENMTQFSYLNSALYRAISMLSRTGGKIVVCGDVNLISGRALSRYTRSVTCFSAPSLSSQKSITLTSKDGTTDYRRTNGAELIIRVTPNQHVDLEMNIASVWEDIDIVVNHDYSSTLPKDSPTFISCGAQRTVFKETVNVYVQRKGVDLLLTQYSNLLPRLIGGYALDSVWKDTDLTVLGGSWNTVIGGSSAACHVGTANLAIAGNAKIYHGVFGGGDNSDVYAQFGNVYVNITGGSISGPIYVSGVTPFGADTDTATWNIGGNPDFSGVTSVEAGALPAANNTLNLNGVNANVLRNTKAFGTINR